MRPARRTDYGQRGDRRRRRALILPLVLLVITILTLVGASFSYMAEADYLGAEAARGQLLARVAAQAGIDRAIVLLRESRGDVNTWYDNPEAFERQLVWLPGVEQELGAQNTEVDVEQLDPETPAWYFSIVADDPNSDDPLTMRFGITDEGAKINLNAATEEVLTRLIGEVVDPQKFEVAVLVDSLLDWIDEDDEPRPNGAEASFYEQLHPPYRPSNRPLQTVEELLMVRGFTGEVLYGEDVNRNGVLEANEDDGDSSWPVTDNGDGVLNRGLYPYVTVYSMLPVTGEQAGPGQNQKIDVNTASLDQLSAILRPEVAEFIVAHREAGTVISNPAELLTLGPVPGSDPPLQNPITPADLQRVMQYLSAGGLPAEVKGFDSSRDKGNARDQEVKPPAGQGDGSSLVESDPKKGGDSGGTKGGSASGGGETGGTESGSGGSGTGTGGAGSGGSGGPGGQQLVMGRVNVNTAPAIVLRALGVFSPDEVTAIVEARAGLESEDKKDLSWLVSSGAVANESFAAASNLLTTESMQFMIESVGYASHSGAVSRLQAVVEMRFDTVPQYLYFRDISRLGIGFPVKNDLLRPEDQEQAGVRRAQGSKDR